MADFFYHVLVDLLLFKHIQMMNKNSEEHLV